MATPTAKRTPTQAAPKAMLEVVDPRWLLKALALTFGVAGLFSYLALCLLIYQGSWQLMLHPSTRIDATPSIPFQAIRFDSAATGKPRLTGWWIPAQSAEARTILFLHDGSGSLSTVVPELELLHQANLNLFAIDYRGFGQSDPPHPTEARMTEDSAAAFDFLTATRHIPAARIVPYGEGLGAVLAIRIANRNNLPAFILNYPNPGAFAAATRSGKTQLLPMAWLEQEHFDLAAELASAKSAKLLFANDPFHADPARTSDNKALFRNAPDPKMTVTFDRTQVRQPYLQSIQRFLDEY